MTTAKQSQPKLLHKSLTALALLMATSVGATALYQIPTNAQSRPDVILYEGPNFTGRALRLSKGQVNLGAFNNKASSIKVLNKQNWRFWSKKNEGGKRNLLRMLGAIANSRAVEMCIGRFGKTELLKMPGAIALVKIKQAWGRGKGLTLEPEKQ